MSCNCDGEARDEPPESDGPFNAEPALPSQPEDLLATAMRRNRELEALFQASQRLNSSLSVAEICQAGLDALAEFLGYQHLCIYFSGPGGLVLQVQRGFVKLPPVVPGDRGIMARAAAAQHTVLVPDAGAEPDYIASMPHVRSEIAVPLLHANRVFGVLNVETLAPQALGLDDERLLNTFANNLAVAIENARLYEETQRQLVDLAALHEAGQALNSDLTLEAVLNRVADHFLVMLRVDTCAIARWDPAASEFVVLLDRDPDPELRAEPGARLRAGDAFYSSELVRDRRTHLYRRDDRDLIDDFRQDLAKHSWQSLLVLPLLGKGQLRGMVELGIRSQNRGLGEEEIRLAESLASQAAIAIENAQLYADARGRLNEMQTLFEFVASLTRVTGIEQVAQNALDSIARLVPFDIGQVGLRDEPNGMILPIILRGGPFESELISTRALELLHEPASAQGEGVAEWVAAHGRAYRVADVQSDPRSRPLASAIRSQLCVPLKAGDRVIGIVDLESERGDAFDERAEQLLTTIANPLAIAIANAQLYEQTRDDARVKAALLRELSHRVKNNLAAITSLLQLALSQPPEERENTLLETLGRAESMVLAHTLLASSDLARVNLLALGDQVLSDAVRHLAPPDNRILVDVSGDAVEIAPRQLTTIALVLNELATNAIMHGLSGPERAASGLLELHVRRTMNGACITLSDDGTGLAGGFSLENSAGIGLGMIRTLVEKDLHGSFSIERRNEKTVAVVDVTLDE